MKKTRSGTPLLAALLLGFVCDGHAQSPPPAAGDLGGRYWQLVKFQGSDDKTLTPDDKEKYTIAFESDGRVSVRIDCNRGHGTWKSTGPNHLQFGPLALTRAICPPAPLNDRIPRDWEYVRSYTLKDGHLFLSLMTDGGTYEFEPIPTRQPAISGLPATFVGTLPCADCPGIRYQVNLLPDGTFSTRAVYEGRNTSFDDSGSWELANEGKTLVLQGRRGAPEKFSLRDADTLLKLDADGHEIESKLNYDLQRVPTFVPIEPRGAEGSGASPENTYWKLVQLGDAAVTSASPQREAHLVLNSEAHRVNGSGGCNRLMGGYELNGEQVSFTQMAGTMMACPDGMDTERAFLSALSQVKTWKLAGQQLELFDASGRLLARLEARYMK